MRYGAGKVAASLAKCITFEVIAYQLRLVLGPDHCRFLGIFTPSVLSFIVFYSALSQIAQVS